MHVAKLCERHYKHVATVPLPHVKNMRDIPEAIIWKGRVFTYYVHTTVAGHEETEHPYREVFRLHHADEFVLA